MHGTQRYLLFNTLKFWSIPMTEIKRGQDDEVVSSSALINLLLLLFKFRKSSWKLKSQDVLHCGHQVPVAVSTATCWQRESD